MKIVMIINDFYNHYKVLEIALFNQNGFILFIANLNTVPYSLNS